MPPERYIFCSYRALTLKLGICATPQPPFHASFQAAYTSPSPKICSADKNFKHALILLCQVNCIYSCNLYTLSILVNKKNYFHLTALHSLQVRVSFAFELNCNVKSCEYIT